MYELKTIFKPCLYIFILVSLFYITSCIEPPKYNDVPEITNVEFNKTSITSATRSATDTFQLNIFFQDGDGDYDGSVDNLFITESRTCFTDSYIIPTIERNGNIDDISAMIFIPDLVELCVIEWKNPTETDCLPFKKINTVTDTVIYNIQIKDNAGNESNIFTSPELYIICN